MGRLLETNQTRSNTCCPRCGQTSRLTGSAAVTALVPVMRPEPSQYTALHHSDPRRPEPSPEPGICPLPSAETQSAEVTLGRVLRINYCGTPLPAPGARSTLFGPESEKALSLQRVAQTRHGLRDPVPSRLSTVEQNQYGRADKKLRDLLGAC